MYCTNCGKENKNESKFCVACGHPLVIPEAKTQQMPQERVGSEQAVTMEKGKDGKHKLPFLIGGTVVVLAMATGGVVGTRYYLEHQEEIRQQKHAEYVTAVQDWKIEIDQTKDQYRWSQEDEDTYTEMSDKLNRLLGRECDVDEMDDQESLIEEQKSAIEDFYLTLAESNKEQIEAKAEEFQNMELKMLTQADEQMIADCSSTVETALMQEDYQTAWEKLDAWEEVVMLASCDYDDYQVSVSQYDLSDYPDIKLYVDVADQNGDFVDGLPADAFFVNEKRTIDGEFSRAALMTAAKLNEYDGISIGLVADVSGSMQEYMEDAKSAMNAFVGSVQFDKGDEIELVEFSSDSYICQYFTNDQKLITNAVNSMTPYGSTRLYDTLINEIARINSQASAKCVIGFTDGYDNESVNTAEDVVNIATASNVPVFLIGIGADLDASSLNYIAESTGGIYRNISDVESLEEVYASIYAQEKNVYLLEYTASEPDNLDNALYTDIYVRTEEGLGGNQSGYQIEPMNFFENMYNKFLVAGIDCQTKGERNMLDSGLIVTSEEAYANADYLAYQCQASIDQGGVGSKDSSTFEVLVDYDVIDVERDEDGYILYGMCNYDVSHERMYSKANALEKEKVAMAYGSVDDNTMFWFETNITNYEKLRLVKDTDGKWKFSTRAYERRDGGDAIVCNEVYQAVME